MLGSVKCVYNSYEIAGNVEFMLFQVEIELKMEEKVRMLGKKDFSQHDVGYRKIQIF